jgi:hypothetical protein
MISSGFKIGFERSLSMVFLVYWGLTSGPLATPSAAQAGLELKDRILAVVDEDPVLASDVERVITLGLAEPLPTTEEGGEESAEAFRRRVLEGLIEQRLRFHAVELFGFEEMPFEEVDLEVAKLEQRHGGAEGLERRLKEVGLSKDGLRQLLLRQLMVLTYIEERLGPRIFIRQEDIQAYYQDQLRPQLEAAGTPLPPLDQVRESIRRVLREKRLNDEIRQWTQELREAAEVKVMVSAPPEDLPPVVDRRP